VPLCLCGDFFVSISYQIHGLLRVSGIPGAERIDSPEALIVTVVMAGHDGWQAGRPSYVNPIGAWYTTSRPKD
jgi:hypothetical protein